jgi:hypothetical protein
VRARNPPKTDAHHRNEILIAPLFLRSHKRKPTMPGGKDKKAAAAKAVKDEEDAACTSTAAAAAGAGAAAEGEPSSSTPNPQQQAALLARLKAQLAAMGIRDPAAAARERQTREAKERYAFWETQPVVQFSGNGNGNGGGAASAEAAAASAAAAASQQTQDLEEDGPIDAPKAVDDVKKEPYALAAGCVGLPPSWSLALPARRPARTRPLTPSPLSPPKQKTTASNGPTSTRPTPPNSTSSTPYCTTTTSRTTRKRSDSTTNHPF